MKYLLTMTMTTPAALKMAEVPAAERVKLLRQLVDQLKPEVFYASTVRKSAFLVLDVADPHVQLRKAHLALEQIGAEVTVDPVSNLDEFLEYISSM
ncbi:MAG: hypothetical protein A2W26_02240 [Acidobacteria bacterium RBG_16_64_8]|nr:MAG: hypothetical protein A2W26_02240 [Acidobacteria bacterium RBG_16_64_8]